MHKLQIFLLKFQLLDLHGILHYVGSEYVNPNIDFNLFGKGQF